MSESKWTPYDRQAGAYWGKFSTKEDAELAADGFKILNSRRVWEVLEIRTIGSLEFVLDPTCDEDWIYYREGRNAI